MDEFKISLFEDEYKVSFPCYKSLSDVECQNLLKFISNKYTIPIENIEKELMLKQHFYETSNALDNFSLIDALAKLQIKPLKNVFVNWDDFKSIDVFNLDDLNKYFFDIWFPSSDDIDIFDESLNWILSIRHDGCINFVIEDLS